MAPTAVELTGPLTHHTVRGQFQYNDPNGSADFYAYTVHLRSGSNSSAQTQRQVEADFLRSDADMLAAGENLLFVGDFNMSGSQEAAYASITAPGEAQTLDVASAPGSWSDNPAFIDLHSHSALSVGSRLDLQFASNELSDGSGLDYVANSFRVFGNNGTHILNAALSTGTGQTPAVLAALEAASDHLPVIADYEIINDLPAINLVQTRQSTVVVEGGQNDTYSIVLNTVPTANVTVTVTPGPNLSVGAGPAAPLDLTFTAMNALTPQTVVVDAVDDALDEGNHTDLITHTITSLDPVYDVLVLDDVLAEIRDDDAPSFVINEIDSDTDGADRLEFIEIYDGGVGNAPLDDLTLVFWNGFDDASYFALDLDGFVTDSDGFLVAGNASVENVDAVFNDGRLQNGADGVAIYRANGSDFPGGTALTLANLLDAVVYDTNDADDPGLADLLVSGQPQLNEDENGNRFFESLARIPDGTTPRETITFQATSPSPGLFNSPPIAGITLVQSGSGTEVIESGLGDSYTLVLDSKPTTAVSITATPSDQIDLGSGPGIAIALTFTPANWNLPQTIPVIAVDDEIAEGRHSGLVQHSITTTDDDYVNLSIPNVGVEITDDEQRRLFINEIDSDTQGIDSLEFVEIYDGGLGNTSLNNVVVVFFNGNDDEQYASFDLDGYFTDAAGFFVLANANVPEVDLVFDDNTLQNGANAVALYLGQASQFTTVTTTNLIDAVVYDTGDADDAALLNLITQGSQLDENERGNGVNDSLARVPDGGQERSTLGYINQVPTPGTFNITAAQPSIRLVEKRTMEGQSTNLDFALQSTPASDVEIRIFPNTQLDLGNGVGVPTTIVFTPANAREVQALPVMVVDDDRVEGPHFGHLAYQITSADPVYDGFPVELSYIGIEDNDFEPIALTASVISDVAPLTPSVESQLIETSRGLPDETLSESTMSDPTVEPPGHQSMPDASAVPDSVRDDRSRIVNDDTAQSTTSRSSDTNASTSIAPTTHDQSRSATKPAQRSIADDTSITSNAVVNDRESSRSSSLPENSFRSIKRVEINSRQRSSSADVDAVWSELDAGQIISLRNPEQSLLVLSRLSQALADDRLRDTRFESDFSVVTANPSGKDRSVQSDLRNQQTTDHSSSTLKSMIKVDEESETNLSLSSFVGCATLKTLVRRSNVVGLRWNRIER